MPERNDVFIQELVPSEADIDRQIGLPTEQWPESLLGEYLDGWLTEAQHKRVEALIERDPGLGSRCEQLRASSERRREAFLGALLGRGATAPAGPPAPVVPRRPAEDRGMERQPIEAHPSTRSTQAPHHGAMKTEVKLAISRTPGGKKACTLSVGDERYHFTEEGKLECNLIFEGATRSYRWFSLVLALHVATERRKKESDLPPAFLRDYLWFSLDDLGVIDSPRGWADFQQDSFIRYCREVKKKAKTAGSSLGDTVGDNSPTTPRPAPLIEFHQSEFRFREDVEISFVGDHEDMLEWLWPEQSLTRLADGKLHGVWRLYASDTQEDTFKANLLIASVASKAELIPYETLLGFADKIPRTTASAERHRYTLEVGGVLAVALGFHPEAIGAPDRATDSTPLRALLKAYCQNGQEYGSVYLYRLLTGAKNLLRNGHRVIDPEPARTQIFLLQDAGGRGQSVLAGAVARMLGKEGDQRTGAEHEAPGRWSPGVEKAARAWADLVALEQARRMALLVVDSSARPAVEEQLQELSDAAAVENWLRSFLGKDR
jgi:hypothetical protein